MDKITVMLERGTREELAKLAFESGTTMTALARTAIIQFLEMEAAVRHVKDGQEKN